MLGREIVTKCMEDLVGQFLTASAERKLHWC